MKRYAILLTGLAVALPAGLAAQLLDDRLEGPRRICTYDEGGSALSGQPGRRLVIDSAQTCPASPPARRRSGEPPGTAQLQSWTVEQGQRVCIYEQEGEIWTRNINISLVCPIVAALLPNNSG